MACFSVRRASSFNTRRPSLNGCSASSSCCFTGLLPLSLPACHQIPWWCWLEGPWDLLGENTRWMYWDPWEGPFLTHSHTHTNLKTCPYCSLLAHLDATQMACIILSNSGCWMSLIIHFQTRSPEALKWTRPVPLMAEWILLFQPQGWGAKLVLCSHQSSVSQELCILHIAQV